MTSRRGFLASLMAAPAVILTPKLLMPVKGLVQPDMLPPDFDLSLHELDARVLKQSLDRAPGPLDRDTLARLLWPGICEIFGAEGGFA